MKKRIAIALALLLVLFSGMIDASASGGWIWLNGDTATLYNTLKEAVKASQDGDIIRVKGDFDYASMQAAIPGGRTLVIAGDTKVTGADKQSGITLDSGSALRCENGAGLTMTAFGGVALTVPNGAQINDGRYTFKDNAGKDGTRGISIGGAVKGSGDRNSVVLDIDDKCATNTYDGTATFENCTVSINSQKRTWQDGCDLNLKNASFTVAGYGQGFYINNLTMDSSELTVNQGSSYYTGTGANIQGVYGKINNSVLNFNTGSRAALSVSSKAQLLLTGSTMNLNNDGSGGLNLNNGSVIFDASTLRSNGKQQAVLGIREEHNTNYAHFINGSNFETPATAVGHNIGNMIPNAYIVMGGSHHIFYAGRAKISTLIGEVDTIPVNDEKNGYERLDHFQLADPSINEIQAVNQNGQVYNYPVPNASDDGQKYVWVPGNAVTFKLNNPQAQFADHTTEDKSIQAMRGYALKDAVVANGQKVELPQEPVAPGFRFMGWFTKEGTPFSIDQKVTKDTEVLARWESDAANYALLYHNGAEPDVEFLDVAGAPDRKIKVLGYEQVVQQKPDFARPGWEFMGWADQNGTAYAEGSEMVVPAGQDTVHLYAQWKDVRVDVRFSANGGTFAAKSIFKTKTDVFTITQEAGGEVATVKAKAVNGVKLMDLLNSLDPKLESYTDGLKLSEYNKDSVAQRSGYEMRPSSFSFWGDPQYSWFSDQAGMTAVSISGAVINGPTTYYLSWKLAGDDVTPVPPQDLPADMWGDAQSDSAQVRDVFLGDTFAITAGIQTQFIKSLMEDIEN